MSDDTPVALQLILLIAQVERTGMVDKIWDTALIATIGNDANVPLIQHDVPSAPFV